MKFCRSCQKRVSTTCEENEIESCNNCGKVLAFPGLRADPVFVNGEIVQRIISKIPSENISRQRLYEKARDDLTNMKNGLGMGENCAVVNEAMKYYEIAVDRNFTKGRRTDQVQAACLYISCRDNGKPYLLIDFSNYLQINVYVLGAVFLQLCKVLNLTEHSIYNMHLDPSVFIHKYTASLAGGKNKEMSDVALNIVASMNHHWMQTGRKPSGLWGAASYISALSHGLNCSISDIKRLVHVCGETLSKRLVEFENTEFGGLTIEELNAKVEELKESSMPQINFGETSTSKKLLCPHKGTNKTLFGFGLCKDCYAIRIGFEGGSDPPAFKNAERQRKKNSSIVDKACDSNLVEKELNSQCVSRDENGWQPTGELETVAVDGDPVKLHGDDDTTSNAFDESNDFFDIDDAEVDGYLLNEEEKRYKRIIWEEMNREYLEEQAAKETAAAAAKAAWEENFKNCPEELQAAKEREAAIENFKKERQHKRAAEARNSVPAKSSAEAVHQMLTKKRRSSKINYDVLEKLFEEPGIKDAKKLRTESLPDKVEKLSNTERKDLELEDMNQIDDIGSLDENEDEDDAREAYDDDDLYHDIEDETCDYDD